jgi:uncharacterized membrane protein YfcA
MLVGVIPLGLGAGALTTIAGMGGGMMMVLVLSVVVDPQWALAVTAPALLFGNAHRIWLFREHVDRRLTASLVAGALPAAFVGGLLTVAVEAWVLHWLILGATVFALLKQLGHIQWSPGPRAMVPVGLGSGFLTATTGSGGLLLAPMLLAAGLRSEAYVATGATVAVAMHVGRIAGYGFGGLIDASTLLVSAVIAAAIVAGNWLGKKSRDHMSERVKLSIAWGAMLVAMGLAIAGVA